MPASRPSCEGARCPPAEGPGRRPPGGGTGRAPGSDPPDVAALLADPDRVAAVNRLTAALGDTSSLDRLTRLAALLLDAPYAQISLIGAEQVVVSAHGTEPVAEPLTSPAADSLCTVTVGTGRPLAVSDAVRDLRLAPLPPVMSGGVRAYLGVPLGDAGSAPLGALCVYDSVVRPWGPDQVTLLSELAEWVVAELELRAVIAEARSTATRLGLALDAAQIGSFDYHVDTGELVWDERLVALFGYDDGSFDRSLTSFRARVHPEDVDRVDEAIAASIADRTEFATEYRIVLPGGDVRWIEARGRVLPAGTRGAQRLLGVAYDSTELREARDRLARVLETMNDAFYALDRQWRFTYVNRQAELLLGRRRDELLGRSIWEEFPEARGTVFEERYRAALDNDEPVDFEAPYDPLGGLYELRAWPGPDGLIVYFREITERRRAHAERERAYADREEAVLERERAYAAAEAANTRLALLADATSRLSESLEPEQVLERLCEIVLPELGQSVVVALVPETAATLLGREAPADARRLEVVHVAHADASRRDELAGLVEALPLRVGDALGVGAVVSSGRAEWLPEVPPAALRGLTEDPEVLAGLEQLGIGAALTLPLVSRGRVLGAVTIAEPVGGAVDRSLLADLVSRAAVALDNALLYGAERRTGITLQRSLLPRRLPVVPGLRTAVRYLPGASGAFVGGDWFQGVQVGSRLVLAMGDVMGHGMRSAARMGQLRAIVATLALEGHRPAALLERLASNVDVLLDLDLATLLVADLDPEAGRLVVASAGHPPPVLAPLRGEARLLDVEPGPPLGVPGGSYRETSTHLEAGDTLVLYTDGLVENREESLDAGLERLRRAVEQLSLPPELTCEHVLSALGRQGGGRDDVALLVVALEPTGVPSEAAASPP